MDGAGNDFIVIDNRKLDNNLTKEQIAWLCNRQTGIGADGLIAVEPADHNADYKFRYYNADGGEAEMCGNGARCFGKYTSQLTTPAKNFITFETIVGTLKAEVSAETVRVSMSSPTDIDLHSNLEIEGLDDVVIHSINTGVPHAVLFVDDVKNVDVAKFGAAIRHHEYFSPNGTNVNFAQIIDTQHLAIRTYERGVEGETLACGTGITACALIHHLITEAPAPIQVDVQGGDRLVIGFDDYASDTFYNVTLTGPAKFVFEGDITL
jgi:diaminopimelate epimerase